MKNSMKLALKDGHLRLDLDLTAYGFTAVYGITVGEPDQDYCTDRGGGWPSLRLHVDVDGRLAKPDPAPTEEAASDGKC